MLSIIIASHGDLATGILKSSEMIVGKSENVKTCTLLPSMGPEEYMTCLKNTIAELGDDAKILFLVDLWGGTPFNQINQLVETNDNYAMVTGLNLAILLEALMSRNNYEKPRLLASELINVGKTAIDGTKIEKIAPEEKKTKSKLKEGHIEYVLARVDSRLLHGQIVTGWAKVLNPDRIIIVSDKIAHDNLRKNLIKRAAPSDIKAHIIPIAKLKAIDEDLRFGGVKALLLFENVQDILEAIKQDIKIKEVNLGSIAHKEGKVTVSDAIAMDKADLDAIEELLKLGIKIDTRKVPSDNSIDIKILLNKAKELLGEVK